jgi:hypothetical protein
MTDAEKTAAELELAEEAKGSDAIEQVGVYYFRTK